MGESVEDYRKQLRQRSRTLKILYKTYRIGVSTISDQQINVPKQVMQNYSLKKGDILEWYPCGVDFPDELEKELIAMVVVRGKKEDEQK